jgi:hypothetical protein
VKQVTAAVILLSCLAELPPTQNCAVHVGLVIGLSDTFPSIDGPGQARHSFSKNFSAFSQASLQSQTKLSASILLGTLESLLIARRISVLIAL